MGVSIRMETPKGKVIDITPGGRSAFYTLLDDECLFGLLDKSDLGKVIDLATEETGDFRDSLVSLAYHLTVYDHITLVAEY